MSEFEKNPANDESVEKVTEQTPELTETIEQGHKENQPKIEEESKSDQVVEPKQEGISIQTLLKTKRKEIIAVLAIVALAIVAFVGYNIYDSQPKSIIDEVKVQFSGYEETGKLTYNSEEIASKIEELSYRKAGFNSNQAKALAQKDPVAYSEVNRDPKLASKYSMADALIRSVQFSFDKTSDLKNGDEITFSVVTTSKSAPVKAEKKTFKVENLKEYEKVSASDLLTETPVTFTGLNGSGTITITKNSKDEAYFDFENGKRPKNLKNGDKVTLKVKDVSIDSLKAEGKVVESKTVEVTVEGLKDAKDVKNLIDVLKKNDAYSKELNKNSTNETYTLEPQGSYIRITTGIGNTSSADIDIITVYKVTRKGSLFTNVSYKYYGFDGYELKDDNLVAKEGIMPTYGEVLGDFEVLKEELQSKNYHLIEVKKEE